MEKSKKDESDCKNSIGVVETKFFTFGEKGDEGLVLDCGRVLAPVTVAYETYGKLSAKKDNAILLTHALSGDSHAAGYHAGDDKPGWWDVMVGPGRTIDTDKYFIICSNVIGGCKGSTGPASLNPAASAPYKVSYSSTIKSTGNPVTGKPYGPDFPIITISDMVNAQSRLIDFLGIKKLLCVAGGSMGGMQALQWVASYPERVASVMAISTALKHSPQQIAFSEVGRQAIMADPKWRRGEYYGSGQPERGLAVARMIGHITYMSERSMEEKFSRKLKNNDYSYSFKTDFEVEGYLRYRGDSFVKRFDANSYLYITKAMDYFDLSGGKLTAGIKSYGVRFLVIAFKSDWLYPASQSEEIVRVLKNAGMDASYCLIDSYYGHDAFLLEYEAETRLITHFLNRTKDKNGGDRGYGI
jgi:homoserine O-acetyltransferase